MPKILLPEKILFVDDEPEVLNSFRRQLRGKFMVHSALGGAEGLNKVGSEGPFAVVVSDLKMPGMDGVTFLGRVKEQSPETVRIMLTGFADMENAMAAVNKSNIFRFLVKPCPEDQLIKALAAAIKQHRLVKAERELLEKTLQGSIKVLTDVLAMVNAEAFGRTSRVTHYATAIAHKLGYPTPWELETAAMLSQIGCLTLPSDLLARVLNGKKLDREEEKLFRQHPALAGELIKSIPRMDKVSRIVAYQEKAYDGSGPPEVDIAGDEIPLGARILKVVLDFDALVYAGTSKGKGLEALRRSAHAYDPRVLNALENVLGIEAKFDVRSVGIDELNTSMIVAEDVVPKEGGRKLLAKGQPLSTTLIMSIRNYNRAIGVKEPITVITPLKSC